MICKLTRDQVIRNPKYQGRQGVAARHALVQQYLDRLITRKQLRDALKTVAPAGTEINRKDAWKLVKLGVAVPVDKECQIASDFTQAQIDAAQLLSEKLEVGQGMPDELAEFNATDEQVEAFKKKGTRKS